MIYGQSKYGTSNYGITNLVGISIIIDSLDYTQYVEVTSLKITSNIAVNQDTCAIDIIIPRHVITRPKGGQEIIINNGLTREFAGVILDPQEEMYAPDTFCYHITCRDYTYYFDKRLVTNTYTNFTIGNIAIDIVKNFTSGFTYNNVTATGISFLLTSKKFDHVYPDVAMQWLADNTGLQWWIDYYKDVHLDEGVGQNSSPLPNNTLLPDTDIDNYDSLVFDEDVSQLRNQIYLTGYKTPALYTVTQSFVCDGQNDTFTTTYEPKHLLSSIVVKLGSTIQTNALDVVGGLPSSTVANSTCYVYYTNMTFRFNVAPASGVILNITYYPMFQMVNMYNDPNAFAVMAARDMQDGVYEYAVSDANLTSTDQSLANTSGQLELLKYAYPHVTGQFNSYLQHWEAGQYFYITSNARMDGQFQNQMFYVIKIDKTIVSHPVSGVPVLYYTVYFSDTPYSY